MNKFRIVVIPKERERNETGVRYTGGEEATNLSIMLYLKLDYGYRSLILFLLFICQKYLLIKYK